MHEDKQPTEQLGSTILCLRSDDQPADRFLDQLHALDAVEWAAEGNPDDDGWLTQAAAAIAVHAGSRPVHVIASGTMAHRALLLAAARPELVTSVLAGDPVVDKADAAYVELLHRVRTPTLVVVASPRLDTDTSQAQTIAGGVLNGVMVIVDDTAVPVHRTNPRSFAEWATAFMSIAEGLQTLVAKEETHA